jgi:RND family efflux transporter MFP subunit
MKCIFTPSLCLVAALLCVAVVLSSCGPSASAPAATNEPVSVAVTKVRRGTLAHSVDLTAEFLPWQEVEIHAKVAGYVRQINVDVGDHVKLGDVLATLEIPEIQDEEKQADAAVLTAQEDVKSMQAALDESTLLAQRLNAAAKESKDLIAQQDIDNANAKQRADASNLAASQQKVSEAQANADHLRDLVAYSMIYAPFDGVVTRRYADTGALVQAGAVQAGTTGNSNSMPLVSFAEIKRLRLEFPVPESDVAFVHVGDPVSVTVTALNKTFEAKVARFAQKVDTSTRTMLTEVDVQNDDFTFTPGMYATVRLSLAQAEDALTVPIQCVDASDVPFVLVVKDGRIEKRPVALGIETADRAQILSGLEENEEVVVGNRSGLQPGEAVSQQVTENAQ